MATGTGNNGKKNKAATGVFDYIAGLDIGNGYVKGLIASYGDEAATTDEIDMPSVVVELAQPNALPEPGDRALEVVGDDFFNNFDMGLNSSMVNDGLRRLMGTRSLRASGAINEFNLVGHRSKADQPLSKILVLGIIAAKAVKDYVEATGGLPTPGTSDPQVLQVHATVALALPIKEYVRHRHSYSAAFTGAGSDHVSHLVTVNNFETPVTVQIIFDKVVVIAEGASAQYAITNGGEPLMAGLLADVRARGMELPGITPADVLAASHTIGVDIGEGTVNFPVFSDGKFNTDASDTLNRGYGSVLEDALQTMADVGFQHSFTSRKQLADYLQQKPNPIRRNFYDKVMAFVAQQEDFFIREVAKAFSDVLSDVGAITEVSFVYGGGSGPLRAKLHDVLIDTAKDMSSEDTFPVMYLDAKYSRKLNREGLMIAAKRTADAMANRNKTKSKSK